MKIIETPEGKHLCDTCNYNKRACGKYQIQFESGDSLNMCAACFEALNKKREEIYQSGALKTEK